MGSEDTQKTEQTQSSSTGPWGAAQPLLKNILGRYAGMSTDPTSGEMNAIRNMRNTLTTMPDFLSQTTGGINKLFNTSVQPQVDMWNNAYKGLNANLGGVARGDYLDPYATPGMTNWLDTVTNDITGKVKGVYSGSGRDPTGAGSFAGSLGRGLAGGLAPIVANQANVLRGNQMDAAKTLYGAGGATAQGTAALERMPIEDILRGIQASGALPGMFTSRDQALLGLEQMEGGLPWGNMERLLGPILQMASLGQEGTGSSMGSKTVPQSAFSNILGGATGAAGLLGSLGKAGGSGGIGSLFGSLGTGLGSLGTGMGSLFGSIGTGLGSIGSAAASFLPFMFSDERLKTNIRTVGMLDDGETPVYTFQYKGRPEMHMGVMAQDVEKTDPGAVIEVGGYKAVNYDRVGRRAQYRGMLDDYLEAA